jgi:high-affinity iron transporter
MRGERGRERMGSGVAAGVITFREGLEAALVVGIVLSYLNKTGRLDLRRPAWAGVWLAVAASVVLGGGLQLVGATLEGRVEQLFEGTTMLFAAVVLTWMIFWMRYQARSIRAGLEQEMRRAMSGRAGLGILSLTFLAVFREGVETVLFLSAAAFSGTGSGLATGAAFGLLLAGGAGWAIFRAASRLNLRRFFDVTSILLLLFAAGLVAAGVHEFQEAGLIPVVIEHLWDMNGVINEESLLGATLKSLFGYNGNPSLLEVLAYFGYYGVILTGIRWWTARLSPVLLRNN